MLVLRKETKYFVELINSWKKVLYHGVSHSVGTGLPVLVLQSPLPKSWLFYISFNEDVSTSRGTPFLLCFRKTSAADLWMHRTSVCTTIHSVKRWIGYLH